MLLELSILNFIIFEKIHLSFTDGFNVFTGETGAGKSMIIDSLHLLLGGKSHRDYVRKNSDKAIVQGYFLIESQSGLMDLLADQGILTEEDTILITREIYPNGRSIARINDVMVNISFLKKIAKHLLDIHGQYDQQSILNKEEHIVILDKMCGRSITGLLDDYQREYQAYVGLQQELKQISKDHQGKDLRMEFIRFQIQEIDSANLHPDEENTLFHEHKILTNLNAIKQGVSESARFVTGEEMSVMAFLGHALKAIKPVAHFDDQLQAFSDTISLMIDSCQELGLDLIDYVGEKELDEERLVFLEQRMETLEHLKRKYHLSIPQLLDFRDQLMNELNHLENLSIKESELQEKLSTITNNMNALVSSIRAVRKEQALKIKNSVESQLASLNMKDAIFEIQIQPTDSFNESGGDVVQFLMATNVGMELMPLERILSGGEVSRIMLAIKSIISHIDEIPTMIFDEIDSGISGRTAHMVGEKINRLSENHQIICVTHSPQIAAAAHTHFKIDKDTQSGLTISSVTQLSEDARIQEIARLLSSASITNSSLKNAEEMIRMSR
jgi:DNA repair protein RecN (Recombination protein N)